MPDSFPVPVIAVLGSFVICILPIIHAIFIIICREERQGEQCEANISSIDIDSQHVASVQKRRKIITRVLSMYCTSVSQLYPDSIIEFRKTIPEPAERFCVYWGRSDSESWWINRRVYIILSFLLMAWVYRIAFAYATQVANFKVIKKVYAAPAIDAMSRTNTGSQGIFTYTNS